MRTIPAAQTTAWLSGDYTGTRRPMARATIQKMDMRLISYDVMKGAITNDETTDRSGKFASGSFNQDHVPVELPNLLHVSISRDAEQPIATCTLTFANTNPLPLGQTPPDGYTFDQPGWFTYNRGATGYSTRWGYSQNGWAGLLVPDRLIRTYCGYGFDAAQPPEDDQHMTLSGVWLIDEVQYTSSGTITVTCRDMGRLLAEHISLPPVIPWAEYPLTFTRYVDVANPKKVVTSGTWITPRWDTDSNQPYVGVGIYDGGRPYVSPNGSVYGHHGRDAFDENPDTYWLSVGNRPDWSSAFEYVQGSLNNKDVQAVKVNVHGGPYHVYISVKIAGEWKGKRIIPYGSQQVDTHADINFVKDFNIGKGETKTVMLPKLYNNVDKIRITFSHLWNSGLGANYPYRAAVQEVQVNTAAAKQVDAGTHREGNYGDYTDIVKHFCAWGGLYWPKDGYLTKTNGVKQVLAPATQDPIFPNPPGGRVWGDFELTGTNGPEELGIDVWDKKPLIDCIQYVRDIVNFTFFIDETGGAIWRQPNIWKLGNYLSAADGGPKSGRTSTIIDIDEATTLLELTSKLSSRNVRERVFVGNITGRYGGIAFGFNPYPSGMRRVAGWTDQRFKNAAECRKMADLITIRQMFTYRENSISIAANPAIQIDDQVRIYERVTNEGFYHYVRSINEEWDLGSGEWTYNLTTHWLGESPFNKWAFNPAEMSQELQEYLFEMGLIAGVVGKSYYETEPLNAGDTEAGTIEMAPGYKVFRVWTDAPAHVRLYDTLAARNAEPPFAAPDSHVKVNTITTATQLRFLYEDAPLVGSFANKDIPINVKNRSGVKRSIKVKVTWMRT